MIPANHPLAARMRRPPPRRSTRVLVHGVDGVGKTSFAKDAPKPVFICPENVDLPSWIPSFVPANWEEFNWIIRSFYEEIFGYESIVLDTVDWLYPKSVNYVCRRDNLACKGKLILPDGRDFLEGYGYGKGPGIVAQEWQMTLEILDAIRMRHGTNIVLLSHSGRHRMRNPGGDDYDIIEPNLDREVTDLLCRWPDTVLYAEFYREPVRTEEEEKSKKGKPKKMITNGSRICWTQYKGAHRAKNRSGMPEAISFEWNEFSKYALADTGELRNQIGQRIATLSDPSVSNKVETWLSTQRDEAGPLLRAIENLDEIIRNRTTPTESAVPAQE